jgi:gas vesicle protein
MNMNENKKQFEEWAKLDTDSIDFDDLESKLDSELEEQMADLEGLEADREKIGNPDTIGHTVMNVVWEQFINQVGVVAGEDFIKENRGLTLDLRDSAHIQTTENFEKGKIATHNYNSKEQLEKNYDRYKNKPHGVYRKEKVNPGMDATLKRAGTLHNEGVETVTDIYTGRQIPTQTKLEDGSNNPKAAQREHVKPSAEVYKNPTLQMAYDDDGLAKVINDPENLQGYTTAERNNRKSDRSAEEMEDRDKNKHWEKANERAKEHIKKKEEEGKARLKEEGRKTQKEEALKIGGKALKSVVMGLLASLIKDIIRKLISWFRSGNRKISTFIDSVKKAIKSFVSNLKEHLLNAGNTLVTTIATAIFGPVIGMIKKAWIFLKQGYKSIKQAIKFLKDPANKNMPFSIKMMEVGKIVIVGLTAGGAIVLSEVIEKGLMSIPGFAFEIPLLGSLASLVGMFLGALVSGLIGALALNLIDRIISKKLKRINEKQQIDKRNDILVTQDKLIKVVEVKAGVTREKVTNNIKERHENAAESIKSSIERIKKNSEEINKPLAENAEIVEEDIESENEDSINKIFSDLNDM